MKRKIKEAINNNPIVISRRKKLQKKLSNTKVSLLVPDCLGGILFHDLGMRFLSPTVNLMMLQTDFLRFVLNLEQYLNGTFEFFESKEYAFPCARLKPNDINARDVVVYFTHYRNEQDALTKWNERKARIDLDNIYIVIEERDGITKSDLQKLADLNVRGIVAFTCNDYKDIPYSVYLSKYHKDGEVGNVLKKNHISGKREYEKYFDFVKWFNESNGAPYDVRPFCK